jgi:hypothetical protein
MIVGMSARRIEDSHKDFKRYQKRVITTFKNHNLSTAHGRGPEIAFMGIWPIAHAIRPFYMRKYYDPELMQNNGLWRENGPMTPHYRKISNRIRGKY